MSVSSPRLRGASPALLGKLVWFAVLGGPIAWALQFLFAMQFGLARCESPYGRFQFPVHVISATLGAIGVVVGVLATLVAIAVFRATRADEHTQDPSQITNGRLHFLAYVGIVVNPLTATICAMVAIGVPLLDLCQQS
jgi:membrane protein required for beta-lactamase induction